MENYRESEDRFPFRRTCGKSYAYTPPESKEE